MRNQGILSLLIVTLIACSPDKKIAPDQRPEKWQLVKMSGNDGSVPPSTGSDMDWQEWYLLYSNHTFTKTRERDSTVIESGTYAIVTLSDGKYLELIYKSQNDLIGNCIPEPKELLKFNSEIELTRTWSACDGPGLFYEKVRCN